MNSFFWDTFDAPDTFDGNWDVLAGGGTAQVRDGDLVLDSPNAPTFWQLNQVNTTPVVERPDWSFRAQVTPQLTDDGQFWVLAIGTNDLRHAGVERFGRSAVRAAHEDPITKVFIPYDIIGTELIVQMDAFGEEVKASVWKPGESSLTTVSLTFPSAPVTPTIALWNAKVIIHDVWISSRSIPILDGDFDLDGELDIDDLVQLSNASNVTRTST